MKKLKTTMAALALLSALAPLAAAEETLTYDDLKRSLSLNNTDVLQAIEDHKTAILDVKDAKANWHPQIDWQVSGSWLGNATLGLDFTDVDGSLPISLPNLGAIEIPLSSFGYTEVPLGDWNYNAQVSLSQPIVTWGKIGAAVEMNEEIAAAKALAISDTEDQLGAELEARLAGLYYLTLIDEELGRMEETASRLAEIAEGSAGAGALLEIEAAEARSEVAQVGANRAQIKAQIDDTLVQISSMTGIADLTPDQIGYTPDEERFLAVAEADRELLARSATSNSQPSMQMLTHMRNAVEAAKKATDRSMYWYPDIALNVTAGYGGYTIPFVEDNWKEKSDWSVTVSIAMQGTIWDGGKKANDQKRAASAIASAEISRTGAENQIRSTLQAQFNAMDTAIANISYFESRNELLAKRLELEKAKVELGASGEADVLSLEIERSANTVSLLTEKANLAAAAITVEYLTAYAPQEG